MMPKNTSMLPTILIWVIVLAYLLTALVVFNPAVFSINDHGARLIQIQNLARHNWSDASVDYPGEIYDADGRFSPFLGSFLFYEAKDGKTYGAYSVMFTFPASLLYALLGSAGPHILNIACALGVLLITYRLTARLVGPGYGLAAVLTAGLASPIYYYSVDLWDHLPTLFFSVLSIAVLSDVLDSPKPGLWRLIGAGILIGLAIWIRQEIYFLAAAVGAALLVVKGRRSLRLLIPYGVGVMLPVLALWLYNWVQVNDILGPHVLVISADTSNFTSSLEKIAYLIPLSLERWWAVAALAVVGAMCLRFVGARLWLIAALAAGLAGLVMLNLVLDWRSEAHIYSLLESFPIVVFFAFAVLLQKPMQTQHAESVSPQDQQGLRFLTVILLLYAVGVVVSGRNLGGPTQWGPRFLLISFAIFPVLLVAMFARLRRSLSLSPRRVISALFVLLLALTLLVQVRGVLRLRMDKQFYSEALSGLSSTDSEIIVSDLWWYAFFMADAFDNKKFYLVSTDSTGTLDELLTLLEQNNVSEFTLAISPNLTGQEQMDQHIETALQRAWTRSAEREFAYWYTLHQITFERE